MKQMINLLWSLNAGYSRTFVMKVKKMKKEGLSLKPKFTGGIPKKKRTEDFLKLIKERFQQTLR